MTNCAASNTPSSGPPSAIANFGKSCVADIEIFQTETHLMRRLLQLLAAGLAITMASHAPAQSTYPAQPVRWIVPYVAGGGTDNLARALADAMQPSLGQPIVI